MEYGKLKRALEGILFAAGEPVTAQRLCLGLETDRATLDRAAQDLAEEYEGGKRGIRLLRLEGTGCPAPPAALLKPRSGPPPPGPSCSQTETRAGDSAPAAAKGCGCAPGPRRCR